MTKVTIMEFVVRGHCQILSAGATEQYTYIHTWYTNNSHMQNYHICYRERERERERERGGGGGGCGSKGFSFARRFASSLIETKNNFQIIFLVFRALFCFILSGFDKFCLWFLTSTVVSLSAFYKTVFEQKSPSL